ncbi:MAG: NHL repeat-containing protein [Chloroflexota bacterium]
MDPRRFDELTTLLGSALSRRAGLRAALGAMLDGAPGLAAASGKRSSGGKTEADSACTQPDCLQRGGCCGKTGQCVTPSAAACGKRGKRCVPCKSDQRCIAGECRCPGCLDKDGRCRKSGSNDACGKDGVACQKCGSGLRCIDLGKKEACLPCSERTCPNGCCSKSGECLGGDSDGACGRGGGACTECGRGKSCLDGACVACAGCYDGDKCVSGGNVRRCGRAGALCRSCKAGEECVNGVCASCAGCILNNVCEPGTTSSICGKAGGACVACRAGETCVDGACVPCAGCIDGSGVCRRGIERERCGAGGEACTACPQGRVCAGARCVLCPGCLQAGVCEPGTANNRCGANASACTSCENGQRCVDRACVCDAVSCPNGCCDGNRSRSGSSDTACGTGGVACALCATDYSCQNKTCQVTPGACPGCTSGCCDNGTCRTGNTNANCGKNGEVCSSCTGTKTCESGSCTTCAGCLDNGTCKAGSATEACGTNGGTCSTCATGESCSSGACSCTGCLDGAACKAGTTIIACGKDGGTCSTCGVTQSCNSGVCGTCTYDQVAGVSSVFGASGTGSGQFDEPTGIAATSDGRLLVSDSRNDRVTVWTSTSGTWSQTGSFGASGTGTGEFDFPWGIGIAPNGAAFVCDLWNNRVTIWEESAGSWSQTGEFGTYGSGSGNLDFPNDVAVIANDKVLVADSGNSRIAVWQKSAGTWSQAGTFGNTGSDLLSGPVAVAYDSTNDSVFVGDLNYPLSEWSFSGTSATFTGAIGVFGNGWSSGEFGYVAGIDASTPGGVPTLWVSDADLNRVARWEKTGATWGQAAVTPQGSVTNPSGLTVISGVHYCTSYDDDQVAEVQTICGCTGCRGATSCEAGTTDQICGSNGEVCVACETGKYCAGGVCANCTDWNQSGSIPFGTGNEALAACSGIAAWNGKVLVADSGNSDINSRVDIWQESSGVWSYVGNFGDGTIGAYGIAVASDGRVLVAENTGISEWTESGGSWSGSSFASTSDAIENVAVGAGDLVYAPLTDAYSGDLIQIWQKTAGTWNNIENFAGYGSGPEELDSPKGIAVTADGRVWICDSANNRVSVWQKTTGVWGCVARFGEATFDTPYAIAVDGTRIIVADDTSITTWSESGGSFTKEQTIEKAIGGCGGWTFDKTAFEALAFIGGVLYIGQDASVTTWTDNPCP